MNNIYVYKFYSLGNQLTIKYVFTVYIVVCIIESSCIYQFFAFLIFLSFEQIRNNNFVCLTIENDHKG